MCSACSAIASLALAFVAATASAGPPVSAMLEPPPPAHVEVPKGVLRVCADPNNLPFTNARGEGFENAIARIIGDETRRKVEYTWWPQRRGFVRNTLRAGKCDVVMGVPAGYGLTQTTRPYYRSTYVFVTRAGQPRVSSYDDPSLAQLRIGVSVVGDDYANPPPVVALAARGLYRNVRGYSVYGDYSQDAPPARVIDAVARGDVDMAIAWGPLAGYWSRGQPVTLALTPAPALDLPSRVPMSFSIAMGVRRGDEALRDELDRAIARRAKEIRRVLRAYGVPLLPIDDHEAHR